MKRTFKILSVILCLMLATASAFILPTSATAENTNLLTNPEFITEDGTLTGWTKSSVATILTDSDGSNYVQIATSDTDNRYSLTSTKQLSIDSTKYYKFSIEYKLTDPPSGDFNINNGVYLTFKYNGSFINKVYLTKVEDWTNASFIMYGGDMTSTAWDRFFAVVSNYSRCTLSVKNPSVTVVDPDSLNYESDIVAENLLSNGDFSQYDATIAHTGGNRFTGFSVAGRANNCVNHEQVQVELNGKTTTAAKLTYDGTSYDTKDALFKEVHKVISTDKYYRVSTWIKVTASSYDNTFEVGYSGNIKFGCDKNNGNVAVVKSDTITAECDWQQISFVVNGADWDNDNWDSRIGIWVYRMNCDIYLADMRVEEFVGNVAVETTENGTLEANRNNAKAGDTVEVKALADDGYAISKLYYTDGTSEIDIIDTKVAKINEANVTDGYGAIHNANTYEVMASDVIYTFNMPQNTDITINAVYEKFLLGDINGDEKVDICDLVNLNEYLNSEVDTITLVNADVNEDGEVNDTDITALKALLLNA